LPLLIIVISLIARPAPFAYAGFGPRRKPLWQHDIRQTAGRPDGSSAKASLSQFRGTCRQFDGIPFGTNFVRIQASARENSRQDSGAVAEEPSMAIYTSEVMLHPDVRPDAFPHSDPCLSFRAAQIVEPANGKRDRGFRGYARINTTWVNL